MKERPDLLTAEDYNSICQEMLAFQESNNRLSLDDDTGRPVRATVEDKSFSLIDDAQKAALEEDRASTAPAVESPVQVYEPAAVAQAAPAPAKDGGLLSGLRSLFKG